MTEVYVEGHRIDISTSLSSLITFRIDDIKNFGERETAFTKTVIAPGTANNNIIFGNIFNLAIRNPYDPAQLSVNINFNPAASVNCVIFQDFLQVFKGVLRIIQINVIKDVIEYELSISGTLTKLNAKLSTVLLEDLDFSDYAQTYSISNIVNSWDSISGSGIYYPLSDWGGYSSDKQNWIYGTFRPAFYVREYIDKILTGADFRYDFPLMNTDRFKSLIIPYNQKDLRGNQIANFRGYITHGQLLLNTSGDIVNPMTFETWSGAFWDDSDGANYKFKYIDTTIRQIQFVINMQGTYHSTNKPVTIRIDANLNGSPASILIKTLAKTGSESPTYFNISKSDIYLNIRENDTFEINCIWVGGGTNTRVDLISASVVINNTVPVVAPIALGDAITPNEIIPKGIKQIDFLLSIVKLFNLYVYEDKFDETKIHITPFIDFYSVQSQNAVDWTYKLDRNSPLTIKPLSEINARVYNFNFAEDNDYYNETYKKRYNQTYGSLIFDTQFEFVSNNENVDIIFAGTPLIGYGLEDKVYSTFWGGEPGFENEERNDTVIRILQAKKITGVTEWDILDTNGTSVLGSYTYYGYAGHFDDPTNIGSDINFGIPKELFFSFVDGDMSINQFNLYWSSYMAEITDKDSKMLIAKFKLTPQDILQLDFSKYVIVDSNLYRLNAVIDYNLNIPDTCSIELLKVINTLY